MKIIGAFLFSIIFVFAVSAMGWWIHILYSMVGDSLDEKKQVFILWILILAVIGIACGMTGFMLA